jgi:hypothetical protein
VVGCHDGTFRCISTSIVTNGKEIFCYPEEPDTPVFREDEPERMCTQSDEIAMKVKTVLVSSKKQLVLGFSTEGKPRSI